MTPKIITKFEETIQQDITHRYTIIILSQKNLKGWNWPVPTT